MVVWTEHRVDDSDLPHPDTYRWALYPFDLSHLKALSIRDDSGVPWAKFAIESIEVLDVFATPEEMAIDLSSFPNLSVLRVTPIETIPPMLLTTLSTIALSHRIKTIIMDTCPYNNSDFRELALGCKEDCAPLDLRLSTLSMSRPLAIEIEVRPEQETSKCAEVTECFPALVSRDMVRFPGNDLYLRT
ncbi:hypothetical protein B0H19DRAFT_439631 [Mycena capillaripes]|nr:hypothetical protein B0H19DRAFT_439631 [Mycena capillaripes]